MLIKLENANSLASTPRYTLRVAATAARTRRPRWPTMQRRNARSPFMEAMASKRLTVSDILAIEGFAVKGFRVLDVIVLRDFSADWYK